MVCKFRLFNKKLGTKVQRFAQGGGRLPCSSLSVTNMDMGTGTVSVFLSRKSEANRRWQEITDRTGWSERTGGCGGPG